MPHAETLAAHLEAVERALIELGADATHHAAMCALDDRISSLLHR